MGVQAFLAIIYLYQQIARDAEVLLPQFSFYRDFEDEKTITAIEPRDLLDSTDLDAPWQDDPRYIGTEVLEDVVHHHDDDGSSSAKALLRGDSKNVKKAASTKKKEKPKKNKNKPSPLPLVESIDMSSLQQNSSPPAKKKVRSVDNKSSLQDSSPAPLEEGTSKMVTLSDTQQQSSSSS